MEIFYVNHLGETKTSRAEANKGNDSTSPLRKSKPPKHRSPTSVLAEQVINSAIVAGIAAIAIFSSGSRDWEAVGIAFGIAFLAELRKYRKL